MWRDSNEARCFVPLLAHKHYIEHLSNSSYRFIEENYIAIIIVIELSPSPSINIIHLCNAEEKQNLHLKWLLDAFTHCLMQLRGTWHALTCSYKCINNVLIF